MFSRSDYDIVLRLSVKAGRAISGPPLGPTLGQYGIPIGPFCDSFNDSTILFKESFPLSVYFCYTYDGNYDYYLYMPRTTYFFQILLRRGKGSVEPPEVPRYYYFLQHVFTFVSFFSSTMLVFSKINALLKPINLDKLDMRHKYFYGFKKGTFRSITPELLFESVALYSLRELEINGYVFSFFELRDYFLCEYIIFFLFRNYSQVFFFLNKKEEDVSMPDTENESTPDIAGGDIYMSDAENENSSLSDIDEEMNILEEKVDLAANNIDGSSSIEELPSFFEKDKVATATLEKEEVQRHEQRALVEESMLTEGDAIEIRQCLQDLVLENEEEKDSIEYQVEDTTLIYPDYWFDPFIPEVFDNLQSIKELNVSEVLYFHFMNERLMYIEEIIPLHEIYCAVDILVTGSTVSHKLSNEQYFLGFSCSLDIQDISLTGISNPLLEIGSSTVKMLLYDFVYVDWVSLEEEPSIFEFSIYLLLLFSCNYLSYTAYDFRNILRYSALFRKLNSHIRKQGVLMTGREELYVVSEETLLLRNRNSSFVHLHYIYNPIAWIA